ncbi:MAG: lipid IV(A) 3-deoxy-D-manno-octulosonic acid transferase [Acidiferrobacteraceae bacterium]
MRLSRAAYSLLLWCLLPFAFLRLAIKGLRVRGYWRGWGERLGFIPVHLEQSLWIHAVSVGEVRAAVPLARALHAAYPHRPLLVTTTTPTGAEQARTLLGDIAEHAYLPYDLPGAVERFLARAKPALLLVMETEIWPVLYGRCARHRIPVCLVNARLSARSFRRYRRVPGLVRDTLGHVALIAAQSDDDAGLFVDLGAKRAHVKTVGNVKFDLSLPEDLPHASALIRASFVGSRQIWIAASTHEGEEEAVLSAHAILQERYPALGLILAPRHPERAPSLARLCARYGFLAVRRSLCHKPEIGVSQLLLADTLGELPLLISASDVAFVGGSLVPVGGHNLLEPCALGVPVVFGPHLFNFAEIARLVCEAGAGRKITAPGALADEIDRWLGDPEGRTRAGAAGRALVRDHRGAVARTLSLLAHILDVTESGAPP